eukprot:CAMPEP_0177643592 /NCGR_PEP_ID=MMETSP0447-20121125/8233_1 /TAXON_ID=0 /ORGANISM="Stygamoeba regulata, Strain BSH-02190019" /LENGTH=595 /DNA_ID=CAMNT_0019145889 /DNA_START=29 /DNA_END=1812 /DNA_ORIENTATION=+
MTAGEQQPTPIDEQLLWAVTSFSGGQLLMLWFGACSLAASCYYLGTLHLWPYLFSVFAPAHSHSLTQQSAAESAECTYTAADCAEADVPRSASSPPPTDREPPLLPLSTPADPKQGAPPQPPPEEERARLSYHVVIFCAVLLLLWASDSHTHRLLWAAHAKQYVRDAFLLVCLFLALAAAPFVGPVARAGSSRPAPLLSRAQTEEWKGWMQALFLLYHYFGAREVYNMIRVLIAAYVWMTGFGHFSYYWVRADFGAVRVLKMLFRLNFYVLFLCLTMDNPYMLYYICPMHTLFFLATYLAMALGGAHNHRPYVMPAKLALTALAYYLCFEVEGVFPALWTWSGTAPLLSLGGSLHEWQFRTTLDHWMPLFGMLCAYLHPSAEHLLLERIERLPSRLRLAVRALLAAAALTALWLWAARLLLPLDKYAYNALHPYTAWLPLLAYLVLRNLTPTLRAWHLTALAFCGRITLETYLTQFHLFLSHDAALALYYLPAAYPLTNFFLASLLFVVVSYLVFQITQVLSDALIPYSASAQRVCANLAACAALLLACYAAGLALRFYWPLAHLPTVAALLAAASLVAALLLSARHAAARSFRR